MVSLTAILATVSLAVTAANELPTDLAEGEFFRPDGDVVSGFPSATTPFRRSPCPILNALANHGYLPRDGKDVTKTMVREAVVNQLNLDVEFANTLLTLSMAPETFDLNQLSTHGLIEHDASLVHADSYFGFDPATTDLGLVQDLLSRGDGMIYTVQELGDLRRERLATCLAVNPTCSFSARDTMIAYGESGIILDVLGGNRNATIMRRHLASFLVDEQIPGDFIKSPTLVTTAQVKATADRVFAIATAPQSNIMNEVQVLPTALSEVDPDSIALI